MTARCSIKRLWTSLLVFLLAFSLASSVSFAETDVFAYTDFYDGSEFNEVAELLSKRSGLLSLSSILGPEGKDLSKLSCAYKMHGGGLLFLADPSMSVSEGISEDYNWILLTDDLAQIRINKTDGNWEVDAFSEAPKNSFTNHIRINLLKDAIASLTVKNLIAFECSRMSRAVFVYVQAEEGEFLVPFLLRPDFTQLRTGVLYSRDEAAEVVSREFRNELKEILEASEEGTTEASLIGGGGGSDQALPAEQPGPSTDPSALSPGMIWAVIGGCAAIIVLIVLAVVLLKKRKRVTK